MPISSINGEPIVPTAVALDSITDDMLAQNGGVLDKLSLLTDHVGFSGGSTEYNHTLGGNAISNTNRWFLNGTCPDPPLAISVKTLSSAQGTSAAFEVWGLDDGVLTMLKKIPANDLVADSWYKLTVGELDGGEHGGYMVSVIPSANTLSATIEQGSGFAAYRTQDLTSTQLAVSSLATFDGLCVNGYVDYGNEPIATIVDDMSSDVGEIEQNIGMGVGETTYNTALLNNAISNTNRWFLNGYSSVPPTRVHFKALPNAQGSTAVVEFWAKSGDSLVRVGRTTVSEIAGGEWKEVDAPDLGSIMYPRYYVSVLPAAMTISATILSGSGYNALRTTDLTSARLDMSSLLTFEGLCVNGYFEYSNPPIVSRVERLEYTVGSLSGMTNPLTVNPDGSAAYETIADAVAAAVDGDTILVYPSTYEEPIEAWGKTVHIIGLDRDSCIIHNGNADYATPAVEISSGSLRNFTIVSDASDPTIDSSTWGYMMDYCIHIDHASAANKTLFIDNCRLLNNHRTAIGCGLYDHNTVTISNCEIWSGKPDGYHPDPNNNRRGAVYFHNRQPAAWFANVTEQLLVFHDNIVMCDDAIAVYIGDTTVDYDMEELGYVNEMSTRFFNNVFAAKDASNNYKTTDVIGGTGFTERLVNEPISFGNNASQFNA